MNFAKFLKTRFLFNISGQRLLFDPVSAFRIRIFPRSFRYKILRILKNHQRKKNTGLLMFPEDIEMEHYLELDVGSSSEFNERI